MFHQSLNHETQSDIDASTLRAMVDFTLLCDPQGESLLARRPFRINTNGAAWTGAFLPGMAGAVAVECELRGDVIGTHTREGRDLSWCLKQVSLYARSIHNVTELERRALDTQEHANLLLDYGQKYQPGLVLSILRALGAPDPRITCGHFALTGTLNGVPHPQMLALSGTVARAQWRAFIAPVVAPLANSKGDHSC